MITWFNISKAGVYAAVQQKQKPDAAVVAVVNDLEAPPATTKLPIYTNYIYYDISWMNDVFIAL